MTRCSMCNTNINENYYVSIYPNGVKKKLCEECGRKEIQASSHIDELGPHIVQAPLIEVGDSDCGCYLDGACRDILEMSRDIIDLAVGFGMPEPANLPEITDEEDCGDAIDAYYDAAMEATDWLNCHTTPGYSWVWDEAAFCLVKINEE